MFIDILLEIDHGGIFTFLFSFESFQYLHECLGYLLENKKIDDDCLISLSFLLKIIVSNYIWHH